MRIVVYLPFLCSALLAVLAPRLGRRLPPATATRLLVATGLACAGSVAFVLAVLAWTRVGQLPLVAALGNWSVATLRAHNPVPAGVAEAAGVAFGVTAVLLAGALARRGWALARARRTCRDLRGAPGGLVVVDDPAPDAFALPGSLADPGRIVVTSGMLRVLSADERQVLLAHEGAHLRHRHHLYRTAAAAAAALNPLLATLPGTVHYLTERWADEDAAREAGDRHLTGRALARAALTTRHAPPSPAGAALLCFHRGGVPDRVRSLLAEPPRLHPLAAGVLAGLLVASLVAVNAARGDTEHLFEQAMRAHRGPHLSVHAVLDREAHHLLRVGLRDAARHLAYPRPG